MGVYIVFQNSIRKNTRKKLKTPTVDHGQPQKSWSDLYKAGNDYYFYLSTYLGSKRFLKELKDDCFTFVEVLLSVRNAHPNTFCFLTLSSSFKIQFVFQCFMKPLGFNFSGLLLHNKFMIIYHLILPTLHL